MSAGFRPRVAVRWRDLDPLGHVNSAVFLTYLEEGRSMWLAKVLDGTITGDQWVVARVELDYLAEVPGGSTYVETEHRVVGVGRSSITFEEKLYTEHGTVAAAVHVVIVMWRSEHHRSRPITSGERAALMAQLVPSNRAASLPGSPRA